MPPKAEIDPVILEQRRLRNREKGRLRMQKHRSKGKQLATTLLTQAFEQVGGFGNPRMSIGEHQSLAQRTAQAILKGTLRRHGITLERLVKAAAEALEAVKFKSNGSEVSQHPDFGQRLRAVDVFLELLQRVGDIPDSKFGHPHVPITVNVLVIGEDPEVAEPPITVESASEGGE